MTQQIFSHTKKKSREKVKKEERRPSGLEGQIQANSRPKLEGLLPCGSIKTRKASGSVLKAFLYASTIPCIYNMCGSKNQKGLCLFEYPILLYVVTCVWVCKYHGFFLDFYYIVKVGVSNIHFLHRRSFSSPFTYFQFRENVNIAFWK